MKIRSFKDLTKSQQELIEHAAHGLKNAFNPVSNFAVGAAVRTKKGNIYEGANMNISSTGLVACAELAAILAANTHGERAITAIAVIAQNGRKKEKQPNLPCARCCQRLHELNQLSNTNMEMLYASSDMSKVIVAHAKDFLPHPFVSGIFRK